MMMKRDKRETQRRSAAATATVGSFHMLTTRRSYYSLFLFWTSLVTLVIPPKLVHARKNLRSLVSASTESPTAIATMDESYNQIMEQEEELEDVLGATMRTGAPTADDTKTTIGVDDHDCDPMEAAYAPDCCPLRDDSYANLCQAIFNRPSYSSSGMIEMHEEWIGNYDIAEPLATSAPSSAAAETTPSEQHVDSSTAAVTSGTTPSEQNVDSSTSAAAAAFVQPECDQEMKKYAPVCCPMKDASFEEFCQNLFHRANITTSASQTALNSLGWGTHPAV